MPKDFCLPVVKITTMALCVVLACAEENVFVCAVFAAVVLLIVITLFVLLR